MQKYRLLRKGMSAVDLGAAPGGWMQVLVERTGAVRHGLLPQPQPPVSAMPVTKPQARLPAGAAAAAVRGSRLSVWNVAAMTVPEKPSPSSPPPPAAPAASTSTTSGTVIMDFKEYVSNPAISCSNVVVGVDLLPMQRIRCGRLCLRSGVCRGHTNVRGFSRVRGRVWLCFPCRGAIGIVGDFRLPDIQALVLRQLPRGVCEAGVCACVRL